MPTRRTVVLGGAGLAAGGAGALFWYRRATSPEHVVLVENHRETAHDVAVETALGGFVQSHGPTVVEPGATWTVVRVGREGTLTARFDVDGERVWETTHDVPTPDGSRRSFVHLVLEPDGELSHAITVEE